MKSEETNKFWDTEISLATVTTDNGEITIKEVTRNGNMFVDIRKWYVDRKSDELKPGKGIAIPVEQIEDVYEALTKYMEERLNEA